MNAARSAQTRGLMRTFRRTRCMLTVVVAVLAAGCGGGGGGGGNALPPPVPAPPPPPPLVLRLSTDPFTNSTSQHATEVEPSAYARGMTIVSAFQTGRFLVAGASDIGFATSQDGGNTWTAGALPGTTSIVQPGSPFMSVSDAAVAYDAARQVWLIVSLPIPFGAIAPAALVSRSTDALHWNDPVSVAPGQAASDKTWIACDDGAASPFFGHCYVEWDDPSANGIVHMSVSNDGGATWGPPQSTVGNGTGLGGQPLVQPNGTVIVPLDDFNEQTILAFVSRDGGASWTQPVLVSPVIDHLEAGGLRSGPLVSAGIDAGGTVYAVWQDCRFRPRCAANDLVLSASHDGVGWSAPARIPIDATGSGIDHFIPGLAVDAATAGAHLGVTYYYYGNTACTQANCQLFAGFVSSPDGGATWTAPTRLAGPMNLTWLPQTTQGFMVGDYMASVFSGGQPIGVFEIANAPAGTRFDQATYASRPGALVLQGPRRSSARERPIPGAVRDPGPRPRPR